MRNFSKFDSTEDLSRDSSFKPKDFEAFNPIAYTERLLIWGASLYRKRGTFITVIKSDNFPQRVREKRQ